jgi:hypothetical protein
MNSSHSRQPQNLLLVVTLLLLCIYTTLCSFFALFPASGEYSRVVLTKANYAGFGAVASCFFTYFIAPRIFKRVLGVTLLLALFNLVSFLPISLSIGITLGDFPIGVNPFGLAALLTFYFLNRSTANAFVRTYLIPAPTPARVHQLRRESIDQFKQTFARKSDDSLQRIVQERKLVGDAIVAAQELLAERGIAIKAVS